MTAIDGYMFMEVSTQPVTCEGSFYTDTNLISIFPTSRSLKRSFNSDDNCEKKVSKLTKVSDQAREGSFSTKRIPTVRGFQY
jgi:hypothetical protein